MTITEKRPLKTRLTERRFYQRQIPLFIISLIGGIIAAEYVAAPFGPLDATVTEIKLWGSLISAIALTFGHVMILRRETRRLLRYGKQPFYYTYRAAVVLGTTIFFFVLALTNPGLHRGKLFMDLFQATTGYIGNGLWATGFAFQIEAGIRKFVTISTLDSLTFWVSNIISTISGMTAVQAIYPGIISWGVWITNVPYTATQRAALMCAAIGQTILGMRALAGQEPGLIEQEVTK